MPRILDVWFNNNKAGQLIHDDSGRLWFVYDNNYLGSKHPWPLSVTLPLQEEAFEDCITRPFFSGLLPDDIKRQKLARLLGVSEKNPFSLLEVVGGECAGAVSLYPEGAQPYEENPDDIQLLDENSLDDIFALLRRRPLLAGEKNVRLSLAGAQDKLAIRLVDNKIALMRGGAPTTHILKTIIVDIGNIEYSLHNELFCLRLAKKTGLPVPYVELRATPKEPFLLIERYDRVREDLKIIRLHQEDFCQALSIPPENKYECEGGPGIQLCLDTIQKYSIQPIPDRITFLNVAIFNYLIGNADAHGKNFSFLHKEGMPCLAPAYDLLSTAVYPDLDSKMAMKIGGEYQPNNIFLRHWHRIVPDSATARKALEKSLVQMARNTLEQANRLKDDLKKKGIVSPVFDLILDVIKFRTERILSG